ncbi:DNA replication and repair protein RecO [Andreprevotia lacus DSM 23236]|jgi:DNA repair protein RecO (recombination protein O)|uniref:DNA repair protein RecO n=1 Tax=Andreprevotia lacus DSM 23236 TaxID=1121001 RepID=A0A1W1XN71_9NEIS|nr:DNA repair protein RecO [Andreprevotia lacus]SMC25297.1 DNA replication and repair protein RecO [Andreprevotia lacus DSM 23236]
MAGNTQSKPAKPRKRKSAGDAPRVDAAPAFILHQYPYRETSKLLEVFTRDHGRVVMVARGTQRPGSQLRGVLLAFQPILLSWFGSGEVKTLHAAEWQGGTPQLTGLPLLCGFYLNELLLKLLPREEPDPALFVSYFEAVQSLAALSGAGVEPVLRSFELQLLRLQGYAPDWGHAEDGSPVRADGEYGFLPGQGVGLPRPGCIAVDGATLIEAAAGAFVSERTLAQGKLLIRAALGDILADTPLHTRRLLLDLNKL